jgi:hypothetical protein
MKRFTFLFAGIFILIGITNAQTISLTGFGGYTFQDKVSFANAYGYIKESGH